MVARVLIVEDEMIVQMHLKGIVERLGCDVVGLATTPDAALAAAAERAPDLVLMDVQLARGGDGVDTAAALRDRCDCAVLFITGNSDDETIARASGVAPAGYLIKPFTAAEVTAAVRTGLASHGRLREARQRERALGSALGALREGVLVVDRAGAVQFASPGAAALCGRPAGHADADLLDVLQPLDDADARAVRADLERTADDGTKVRRPGLRVRTPDGRPRALDLQLEPVRDPSLGSAGVLVTLSEPGAPADAEETVPAEPRRDGRTRLLVYSHDTLGLGHLRRSLKLVRALAERVPDLSTLLVTGSPVAHRFELPPGADYLKLPAVRKVAPNEYAPRSLSMTDSGIHGLRSSLLLRTVRDYAPDVLLVDHSPSGMNGELLPALEWLEKRGGCTRILGLRDVIDDPDRVVDQWTRDGVYDLLRSAYDRVVVYGSRAFYDTAAVYRFPDDLVRKTVYLNHVGDQPAGAGAPAERAEGELPLVALTIGGGDGGDDTLVAPFLEMMGRHRDRLPLRAVAFLGPFVPAESRARLEALAAGLPVELLDFVPDPTEVFRRADLVLATAGYNTSVELLAHAQRAIQVPRVLHRDEQRIRASRMAELGLTTWIHPGDVTPDRLLEEVERHLSDPARPLADARARGAVPLDGAERLAEAVHELASTARA